MKLKRVILLFIVAYVFATSANAAQVSVEPAYQEVCKEDNITVNITVDPEGSSVYAASYTLHFDNTILSATSQTQGPFLTQDGQSSTGWRNEIDNTAGTIEYSESGTGTDAGVNDSGVLATITFQVISDEGTSELDISDYNGELLYSSSPPGSIPTDVNNGTCEIGIIISQTPTPTLSIPPTPDLVQTPATTSTTPTPTEAAIQTPTISPTPSASPTMIISPISTTASTAPPKEKAEENNGISGFRAVFAITGLLTIFILKIKNVIK